MKDFVFYFVRIRGFFPLKNKVVWQLKLFLGVQLKNCLLSFFLQQTLPFWQSVDVFHTSLTVFLYAVLLFHISVHPMREVSKVRCAFQVL